MTRLPRRRPSLSKPASSSCGIICARSGTSRAQERAGAHATPAHDQESCAPMTVWSGNPQQLFSGFGHDMLAGVSQPQTVFPRERALVVILLIWALAGVARAQTPSVVTLDSNKVFVINGRKVFPIGFFSGPPINGQTPDGRDARVSGCGRAAVQDDSNEQLEQPGYGRPASSARLGVSARDVLLGEPAGGLLFYRYGHQQTRYAD